jgi:hypothetical protein
MVQQFINIITYVYLQVSLCAEKLDTSWAAQLHGPLQGKGSKAWTSPGQYKIIKSGKNIFHDLEPPFLPSWSIFPTSLQTFRHPRRFRFRHRTLYYQFSSRAISKLDYPEMEFLVEFYALCYSQSFLTYSTYFVFKNLYKKISEPRLIKSLHENYFVE